MCVMRVFVCIYVNLYIVWMCMSVLTVCMYGCVLVCCFLFVCFCICVCVCVCVDFYWRIYCLSVQHIFLTVYLCRFMCIVSMLENAYCLHESVYSYAPASLFVCLLLVCVCVCVCECECECVLLCVSM